MTHTLRTALAVAALLCLSQLAHAGPLRWGYRAESPDGAMLAERTGITDLIWSDYFLPDPLTHGVPTPDPFPDNDLRTDILRSEATVTITDETSGQSGTAWLFTEYRWQYELKSDGTWAPYYEGQTGGPWPERTELVLGGNTFTVGGPGGEFLVEVTPGPVAATPEPGTLALAGLGLVGVFARRVRRSRAVRAAVLAVLVCAGLFGASGSATAGPIEWNYLANFRTDGDRPLRIGSVPGPDGNLQVVTTLRGEDLEGPGSGTQRVRIGSLLDIDVNTADSTQPPGRAQWLSDLTITDLASGQSGMVTVAGGGKYLGDDLMFDRKVMIELLDGDAGGRRELILGSSKYSIQYAVVRGVDDRISTLVADVSVSPVAATPEPGTLALAGLGLLGVFARRVRPSRTVRPAVLAVLVCLGVFGQSQSASAGPIEWSMRGDVDASQLGRELYLGAYNRWLPDGGEEVVHVYGELPGGVESAGAGSQDYIMLGAKTKQAYRYDSAPPADPEANREVTFNVSVTDTASGETGSLSLSVSAYFLTGLPQSEYGEMVYGGSGGGVLLLGGNRYDVQLNTSDGDEGTYVSANLIVAPVAATPEPGTFALAGLGLGALGIVRRMRRAI